MAMGLIFGKKNAQMSQKVLEYIFQGSLGAACLTNKHSVEKSFLSKKGPLVEMMIGI